MAQPANLGIGMQEFEFAGWGWGVGGSMLDLRFSFSDYTEICTRRS